MKKEKIGTILFVVIVLGLATIFKFSPDIDNSFLLILKYVVGFIVSYSSVLFFIKALTNWDEEQKNFRLLSVSLLVWITTIAMIFVISH